MNARAQTLVHLSMDMTRQERDEIVVWIQTARTNYPAPTGINMLLSVLEATERVKDLPITDHAND